MINHIKNYCTIFLTGTLALTISSCAATLASSQNNSVSSATSEVADASLNPQPNSTSATPAKATSKLPSHQPSPAKTQSTKTIAINIYQADLQCQGLVAKKIAIPSDNSLDNVVAFILKQTDSADFNLAGYRVKSNPTTRIATVDLRLPPQSKRQFVSLSNCEQLALFGSLRKTLTSNPKLNIKEVRFTNQGTKISF